jgi:phosphopantothenoylcysteine synthetase/decarboxylase
MDRAEIISDDVTMKTPAGTFKSCIRVEETSGIDPEEKCYKTYAPGLGLIQDEDLVLTGYRKVEEKTVSLKDLPRAVRAAIKKHAAGGKITEIVKETVKGKLVYEAEVLLNGRELDILVSAKGKYLGTEKEEEDKAHHDEDDQENLDDDEDDDDDDDNEEDDDNGDEDNHHDNDDDSEDDDDDDN